MTGLRSGMRGECSDRRFRQNDTKVRWAGVSAGSSISQVQYEIDRPFDGQFGGQRELNPGGFVRRSDLQTGGEKEITVVDCVGGNDRSGQPVVCGDCTSGQQVPVRDTVDDDCANRRRFAFSRCGLAR